MMNAAGIIAASNMMRKQNDKYRESKVHLSPLVSRNETSEITLSINQETTKISFDVKTEFDWVRAAWALIQICEQKGKLDSLFRTLENEGMKITEGSLGIPKKEGTMGNTEFDKAELLLEKVKKFIEDNGIKSHDDVHRKYTLNRQCSDLVSNLIEIVLEE